MKQTLLISNNEFLNILYVMNLEVYLATTVHLVNSAASAIDLCKEKKSFDLILSMDDAFREINDYRRAYGIKTPLIKIGAEKDEEIDAKTYAISSRYNIQSILKKSASILGVTAKQMAEMQMGNYYGISSNTLEAMTKAPCDVYLAENDGYKLHIKADEKIENLSKKGNKIFVRSSDRLVIVNYASFKIIEKITEALKNSDQETTEKKVEILNDSYEFAMANLFSTEEIKNEMASIATAAAKVMGDVAKESTRVKSLLATLLNNKSGYIFTHSMISSYVAGFIVRNVTWGGEGQTDKINFVLFFHDIYLGPLFAKYPKLKFEKKLMESPLLSVKEKDLVMNHAKLAAELVVTYKRCPMGSDLLIKHHHGAKRGIGFAKKYPEDLSTISKILLVAEAFVEEFMESMDKKEIPDMKLIIPKLTSEFSSPSYLKIIQTLTSLPL